jgi:tetratricopeptide (TPR) repeat protein
VKERSKSRKLTTPVAGTDSIIRDFLNDRRALFLIAASTVLAYANSLSGAFVFDDTKQIAANPALRSWANVARAFTSDVWAFQRGTLTKDIPPPYYRPLFTAYLTINYQLFGLWEPGWHLMNLLVHTGATVIIYFLLKRLSADRLIATTAALIFGLHPAHVESVSWISGIPDPLAALFYVPSLIWYIRYRTEGGTKFLVMSVVAYGLSALCKETPLALPLVFVAWEFARPQSKRSSVNQKIRETLIQLIPYALVGGAYLGLRFSVLGRISWKHPFMAQVPDYAIWMTVPYVFLSYLRHLIAPFYLSLIYGTSFVTSGTDPRFLLPVTVLLFAGGWLWVYRKKTSADLWIALALIVAPLLPVLNLRVFHFEYIVQDRYLYLPSIGFCYLVAIWIVRLLNRRAYLAVTLAAVIIVAFGASTIAQNRVWHDAVALWQRAVYYAPDSWSTHYNLGLAYLNQKRNEAALAELGEAKRLNPGEPTVLNNLALAQNAAGQKTEAIGTVKLALAADPTLLEAHNNLGAFLFDQGSYPEAQREFNEVLSLDPSAVSARFNLGRTQAAMGQQSAAIKTFAEVLRLNPTDAEAHYQLALSYAAEGQRADAIKEIQRALDYQTDARARTEMQTKLAEMQKLP